jgi:hypothetical protein
MRPEFYMRMWRLDAIRVRVWVCKTSSILPRTLRKPRCRLSGRVSSLTSCHVGYVCLLSPAVVLNVDYSIQDGTDNVTTVHISCRVPTSVLDDVKGKLDKKASTGCCIVM